jgi:hypothetical protein
MNKVITVLDKQSIWDIATQEYGSPDGIKQLMIDNPTKCDLENSIPAGTKLIISQKPINQKVYDFFAINKINPATAIYEPFIPGNWILALGTWNDNGFWIDNALWIDN